MNTSQLSKPALLLVILSLATFLLACTLVGRTSAAPESLRIAVSRTPLSTPLYVAAAKGFFRQQGIDVELLEVIGGVRAFAQLADGTADLATSSDSVVMFRGFGSRDFSVLASFVTSDNDVKLLASADSALRTADDLGHTRVAITPQSSSEYFLHNIALMHNVDVTGIETLAVNPERMADALFSEQVEVVATWEPYCYKIARELGEKLVILPTRGLHSTSFNLIARQSIVQGRQGALLAVLRGLDQAIDFMHRNPLQAQAIIADRLGLEQDFVEWVWPDYNFRLGLPDSLLISLDSGARWALANGHVSEQPLPDYRAVLDGSLLRQVLPSATRL